MKTKSSVKLLTVSQNGGSTIIIILSAIGEKERREKKIESKSISLGSNRVEQLYLEISF
jgi:hypothetical protein